VARSKKKPELKKGRPRPEGNGLQGRVAQSTAKEDREPRSREQNQRSAVLVEEKIADDTLHTGSCNMEG